jgi:hypothetical protein
MRGNGPLLWKGDGVAHDPGVNTLPEVAEVVKLYIAKFWRRE